MNKRPIHLSSIGQVLLIIILTALVSTPSLAAEIKVLFIGQDTASEIPAYLTSLVNGDATLTDTINAEFYTESDVLDAYYENRAAPSDSNTLLAKLDEGFDYVFVQPGEEALFKYPGLSLEEIRVILKRLQGSGATVAIPMIWGRTYAETDAAEFEDHTYRIADALTVDVVPAGLAWVDVLNDVASVADSSPSSALTAEASYLMAAATYVTIFEQSATNSTFTPSGLTAEERDSIINHTYSHWVSAATDTHYTGEYVDGFCSPNQIPFDITDTKCVFLGSSTEVGYGSKWTSVMNDGGYDAGRTHVNRYAYDGSPIFPDLMYEPAVSNILAGTYYDFACARFDGYPTTAEYEDLRLYSQNSNIPFIGFRYQGSDIPNTLNGISYKAFWAADHSYDRNAAMGHGSVFNLPAEIAFGRLWDRSEELVQFSGVHVSDYVDAAVASMIYTMMTGENCTAFGHPNSTGQEQEQYEYAQNLGYTIIKQLGSLKNVAYDEANTRPAAVIGSETSAHPTPDLYGGGVFYFVDTDGNGSEICTLHATNSYDYEGSVTGYIWSDQGSQASSSTRFTNLVNTGSASVFGLAVIDDCSQTSAVSEATIRVLATNTLLHDDQDVATSGGYGWSDAAWTVNNTKYALWNSSSPYNGSRSLNLQRTGQASRHIDLSAVTNDVVFEYQWKGVSLEAGETATIEVYDGSWHTIQMVDSSMANGAWHAESIVLSAYNLTSPIEIRFTVAGDNNQDDLYIDAMRIYSTDLAPSPPVATDDAYAAEMNVTLTNAAPGVLGNDTNSDGDALTASMVSTTTNGTLALASDGSFTYQPNLNVIGIDTFTYVAIDATGLTSTVATVTLTIFVPATSATVTYDFNSGMDDSTSGSALTAGTLSYAVGSNSDGNPNAATRAWDNTKDTGDYILNLGQRGIGNSGIADANFDIGVAAQISFTLTPNAGETLDFASATLGFGSFFYADASASLTEGYKVWADTGTGFVALAPLQSISTVYIESTGNALYKTDEQSLLGAEAPLTDGTVFSQHNTMSFDISSLGALATNQAVTFTITISGNRNNQYAWNTAVDNLTLTGVVVPQPPAAITYENWAAEKNAGSPLDDDDLDLVLNLEEYAYNLEPSVADWQLVESGTGTQGLPLISFGGDHLQVEYLRRKEAGDLEYIVQISTNLVDWTTTSTTTSVSSIDGEWERVIEIDPVLADDAATARFIRMKIKKN